jgi:lambda family phage portal protein
MAATSHRLGRGSVPSVPLGRSNRPAPSAEFMRGERSPVFTNWFPVLRDSREDVRAAYSRSASRSVDLIQNSGWLAGTVRKSIASTIGTGLHLAAKPDPRCFGGDQAAANQWARGTERDFEGWAKNPLECDAAGKWNMAKQAGAALRSHYAYGEIVGLVPWIRRSCSRTRTKLQLMPPHRLTQEGNGVDLFQGVRIDGDGLPQSYRFQLSLPLMQAQIVEIPARDAAGRPRVMHIFDGDVGQMRGISPFTPALKVVRQFDQLSDATLTAALIQAIFAATVQSPAPTTEILSALQDDSEQGLGGSMDDLLGAKSAWYDTSKIDLYGSGALGKIAHLFPGEELNLERSQHPNDTYEPFAKFLLHEFASCTGISYSTVSGDYSGATYSSVRMETSVLWPVILWQRHHVAAPFYQTGYECWLEEEIDNGRIGFPGGLDAFIAQRDMVCRGDWRGPPKPQADDLKYAKAVEILFNLGIMTAEQVCAELGTDWEDVFEQLKREADMRKTLGLPDPRVSKRDVSTDSLDDEAA